MTAGSAFGATQFGHPVSDGVNVQTFFGMNQVNLQIRYRQSGVTLFGLRQAPVTVFTPSLWQQA